MKLSHRRQLLHLAANATALLRMMMLTRNGTMARAIVSNEAKLGLDRARAPRRLAAAMLVSALILPGGAVSVSYAQVSPLVAQKSPDAGSLNTILDRDGHAFVIIEFAVPDAPSGFRADAAFLIDLKTRIATLQDSIIADHFGNAAAPRPGQGFERALQRMDITAMIVLNVTRAELEAFAADPRIVRIHENKVGRASLPDSVPLVGMTGVGGAFSKGATGGGRSVAILDSGVLGTHEFLAGKVIAEACFSSTGGSTNRASLCPNGGVSQSGAGAADPLTPKCISGSKQLCFHGTMTAGIAAGNNGNITWGATGKPPAGVGKSAQIVAIQVMHRHNLDTECAPPDDPAPCLRYYESDLVAALNFIASALGSPNGVKLAAVNLSLGNGVPQGTYCNTNVLTTPINNLQALDIVTVIAAGNDRSVNGVSQPACISSAFAVAASMKIVQGAGEQIAGYTNMGQQVRAFAPGGDHSGTTRDILTSNANTTGTTNLYDRVWGSSMAAPHVAGAIAALKSACPQAPMFGNSPTSIVTSLSLNGPPINDTRPGGTYQAPRIDVKLAWDNINSYFPCSINPNTHDPNGDHKSDIAWRDTTNGSTAVWLMNGSSIVSSAGLGAPSTTWSIVGQRDFDGDSKADLLWRDTSGNTAMWFMNGPAVRSSLSVGNIPAIWSVIGTGDFNGDSFGDILWRDSSGNVAVWLMNGAAISSSAGLGSVPLAWNVVGTGDYNGDGKSDLLWRDNLGNNAMWFMSGTQVVSTGSVGNVPAATWSVVGTGDFNGDGKSDIVWRDTSGNTSIWLMNGATVSSAVGVGSVPTTWSIALVGDFNGDGRSDLLWRDTGGNTAMWFMNGVTVSSTAVIGNISTSWTVQSINAE